MKQHRKKHNLNLSSSNLQQSLVEYRGRSTGIWACIHPGKLQLPNHCASYEEVTKNSPSDLQVIAKEKDTGRGTTGSANLLTAPDKQLPEGLAAENESFPAVRKLEGLWDFTQV